MNLHPIPSISITSSALDAERTRLDVIASNLANSQTTRDVSGGAYRRKQVVFESFMPAEGGGGPSLPHVRVGKIEDAAGPLPQVHMPGHPHADQNGMVTMPNVNVIEEMVDMMTASRSYEANLQVVQTSRQMFQNSLRIAGA